MAEVDFSPPPRSFLGQVANRYRSGFQVFNQLGSISGYEQDPSYNPEKIISTLTPEQRANEKLVTNIRDAANDLEAYDMVRSYTTFSDQAKVASKAGFFQTLGAEFLFVPNYIVPIFPVGGGVAGVKAFRTLGQAITPKRPVTSLAIDVGAVETAAASVRYSVDPTFSAADAGLSVVGSVVAGAGLAKAFQGASSAFARTIPLSTAKDIGERFKTVYDASQRLGLTTNEVSSAFSQLETTRPLENAQDLYVEAFNYDARIKDLEIELDKVKDGSAQARQIRQDIEEQKVNNSGVRQELFLRELAAQGINISDPYGIAKGGANVLMRMVPTPMRNVLSSSVEVVPTPVKKIFVDLAGDAGSLLNMASWGVPVSQSVHMESLTMFRLFSTTMDSARKIWAEETGAPIPGSSIVSGRDVNFTDLARRLTNPDSSFDNWFTSVNRKRILGQSLTEGEAKAANLIDEFYKDWGQKLREVGILEDVSRVSTRINDLEEEIRALEASTITLSERASAANATRFDQLALEETEGKIQSLKNKLVSERNSLPDLGNISDSEGEPFFSRYWNKTVVRERRSELEQILYNWFIENPYVIRHDLDGRPVRIRLRPGETMSRVNDAIDAILGERIDDPVSNVYVGYSRAGHLNYRKLNIPNRLVIDFIETNPNRVMMNYALRAGPSYSFEKKFGGSRRIVVDKIRRYMREANASTEQINKVLKDFDILYRRIVGRVLEEPESLDQRVAQTLRDLATFTYLGGAGIAAIADLGKIVMDTELPVITTTASAFMDPVIRRASIKETRALAGGLEMMMGSVGLRMVDEAAWNPITSGRMDKAKNAFHTLNLLGPMTVGAKNFVGGSGAHMMIEMAQRIASGTASDFDVKFFARMGLGKEDAKFIANAPWQRDSKSGFILPNIDSWQNSPQFLDKNGNKISVLEASDTEVGQYRNGKYNPVYVDEDNVLHIDRDYIEDNFDQSPWTKSDPIRRIGDVKKLKDAKRFDEKPWTEEPYFLKEDSIQTEEQWLNFLAVRKEVLDARSSFMERQSSLWAMDNKEIIDEVGDDFFVDFLITDPATVKSQMPKGNIGYHRYGPITGRGELPGTVYVDLEAAKRFYNQNFKNKDAQEELNRLNLDKAAGKINDVTYAHFRAQFVNVDLFKNYNDFAEFLLFHELHHGPTRQKPNQSLADYEEEIDNLAIASLRDRRARQLKNKTQATRHALDVSRGNAMRENAFDSPQKYGDFLGIRALIAGRTEYSFKSLGLDGRKNIHKAIRNSILNRATMRELEASAKVSSDVVEKFRAAVNTHINNVVVTATAADKPTLIDGVVHIPMKYAGRFGLKENKTTPGYARIENGFLAMPLQFFNYTFGALNKTTGLMMQGAVRNKLYGAIAMLGAGYLVSQIRTPDYVWDNMSAQDKFLKSFDMSGLAAFHSDLFYTSMQASLALGGPNITAQILQPRYPQEPSAVDAATMLGGAASGWTADSIRALGKFFIQGEYGEGASMAINNLPGQNLWFFKNEIDSMARNLRGY